MDMKRWIGLFTPVVIVLLLTSFGKSSFFKNSVDIPSFLVTAHMDADHSVSAENIDDSNTTNLIRLGNSFVGFKEALGFKESQGKYDTINKLGYLGKYQFGSNTLNLLGIHNTEEFLASPELQEKAFETNVARNKWILRRDIKSFVGKRINGTLITESGIVAAAHLSGAGNVKKYLRSYGQEDFSDAFGSSIAYYIGKFSGYDTSHIKQQRNSRVQ